jgi:hypothetical protein
MPDLSTKRIRHDQFDAGDVSVRCSCPHKGTLIILSLGLFMKMGAETALSMANSNCPRCSARTEVPHA